MKAAAPAKPILGITAGDPAGIGGELLLKTVREISDIAVPVIYADRARLAREAELLNLGFPELPVAAKLTARPTTPLLVDLALPGAADLPYGAVTCEGGALALTAIERAVGDARRRFLDGIVTLPISKAGLVLAGSPHHGHTGMLRELAGAPHVVMAFFAKQLRVALLTTHVPLAAVPKLVTRERLLEVVGICVEALQRFAGLEHPRLGVLGLNPHSGEQGLLGREELEIIIPALKELTAQGYLVEGPLVPDVAFRAADRYDLLLSLYHDQGLIPFKLAAFADGVNVTLGLPFIRTSPAHGTAYDIAGRGVADPASVLAAVRLAARMATGR